MKFFLRILIFSFLTILTQIGGIAYLLNLIFSKKWFGTRKYARSLSFVAIYAILTLIVVPLLAPVFGREKVAHTDSIQPASYLTVILNRNYVRPDLNQLLENTAKELKGSDIMISYLDANFPFINKFPLLPHLSHNDGRKIDVSLIYETETGEISNQQRSRSGYGAFEGPLGNEHDQIQRCIDQGYWQYDFTKFFTLGSINDELQFSKNGNRQLIRALLKSPKLGKLFIEPHLKSRLGLKDSRVRYHGCRAVRHDDHVHIQL